MHYPIVVQKDPDSDYTVAVPDLPGCVTAGRTLEEALTMAKETIELHLEGMIEDGEPIPEPESIEHHQQDPDYAGASWAVVAIDWASLSNVAKQRLARVARARRAQ